MYLANDRWVVGFDPFNEPFSVSLVEHGGEAFDNQLVCFYLGTAMAEVPTGTRPAIACPSGDPAVGLILRLLKADLHHLVFYEPDIFGEKGGPNLVGAMDLPRIAFNIHVYCSFRSGTTGNPTDLAACAS